MRTVVIAWLATCAGLTATGVETMTAAPQRLAMMRAEWRDLETWSHYNESQRETELGLGLQVPGPSGLTFVAFTGVLRIRAANVPPEEVGVQVALNKFGNPNAVRRPSLLFIADAATDRMFRLDLSSKLEVDDPTPGGGTENGATMLKAAEFIRLAEAKTLMGQVLGLEASFRPDQLAAMRAFAERLHFKVNAPAN